jgi:hypothetical protein
MPFTPAHPAILIPLRKINQRYISWTALIVGSMVPDMEYFVWLKNGSYLSHSWIGIPLFNLPMVFIVAFMWHGFMRHSLVTKWPFIKPEYLKLEIPDFATYLRKNFLVFTVSALIGILSHLLWDSFSHAKGHVAVNYFPYLIKEINIVGVSTRPCYVIWYISTLLGLFLIARLVINFKAVKFSGIVWKQNLNFTCKITLVILVIGLVRLAFGLERNVPRHLTIIVIGGAMYGLAIISFLEYYFKSNRKVN